MVEARNEGNFFFFLGGGNTLRLRSTSSEHVRVLKQVYCIADDDCRRWYCGQGGRMLPRIPNGFFGVWCNGMRRDGQCSMNKQGLFVLVSCDVGPGVPMAAILRTPACSNGLHFSLRVLR